ncbi:MAG TPA: hypothetical protein DHV59_18675 [Oxalobacteraceae bacterium]|nr:hypothetical protein [Oxalobacteraceae bacterium]
MEKSRQAGIFAAMAMAASAAWGQATPDLYDSSGKAIGEYKGDSVVVQYNNQPVRVYLDAHYDYAAKRPLSSGLTWKHVPVYYQSANCTGQAYIGTAPTAPTSTTQNQTAAPGPEYSPPAYGSQYLVAPSRQGAQWTAYVSGQNPTYTQYAIQSERQYDGTCAAKAYPNLWVTPAQATVPLTNYGTPPFYAR